MESFIKLIKTKWLVKITFAQNKMHAWMNVPQKSKESVGQVSE